MYNKIILVGNMTRDIELRYSQSGSAIANTAIATSRKFTQNGEKKEELCFVDITFFGRSAEVANQYLHKGSKILVDGRLKLDQWTDNNGQKRSKHSVTVESMRMLDNKPDREQDARYNQPQQQPYQAPEPTYKSKQGNELTQQQYQQQQQQQQKIPEQLPEIDIDSEIPF